MRRRIGFVDLPTSRALKSSITKYLLHGWFLNVAEDDQDSTDSLIERLNATVLGLFEALDAENADISRLLYEALVGSLCSR